MRRKLSSTIYVIKLFSELIIVTMDAKKTLDIICYQGRASIDPVQIGPKV